MIRLLALLVAFALPAAAETARVISGEHPDFTRLVVELPRPSDWTVGRTAMGYGFATVGADRPGYDLTGVWDRIPRTRLQALRVDPDSGALILTLACSCHVFPFEYQPGTVVLDIRNGPAPTGSAFEAALAPPASGIAQGESPLLRVAGTYDWLDLTPAVPLPGIDTAPRFPAAAEAGHLDALRDALLLQLSRAAADGVVDMVLPGKRAKPEVIGMADLSGALIRIGELPGLAVTEPLEPDGMTTATETCFPDDVLDLAGWGDGRRPLDLLVEARSGLYGEFDTPSTAAIHRAIKLHLYLGFGAEALQFAALLPGSDREPDLAPLLSMARLIDGDSDPASPFARMLECDGTAALWAALAFTALPTGTKINTAAIARSFQALPAHLRRHLGPRLASLLVDRDAEAARMIRDAVERTPDLPAGTVALIDAEADLQSGRPEAALTHAEAAVEEGKTGLTGLITLVEAHFQSGQPLAPEVAESLLAYRDAGVEDGDRRTRALALALALSGQEDAAFALATPDSQLGADIWRTVSRLSADDPFLAHAVLMPGDPVPTVDPQVSLAIAARLVALGFPEAALVWLGPVDVAATEARRVVAANAELDLGDARMTLQLLSGMSGPEVLALQAAAHQQLGAYVAAEQALSAAGKVDESLRLATWEADWTDLKDAALPEWATVAALLDPQTGLASGPLAQGKTALEDSSAARAAVKALLAKVPLPDS